MSSWHRVNMRGSIRRQIVGRHSSPFLVWAHFQSPRSFPGNSATGKNEEEARAPTELREKLSAAIVVVVGSLGSRSAGGRVRRCRCIVKCTAVYRNQLMSCCCCSCGSLRPTSSSQAARLLTAERSRAAFSLPPLLLLLLLRCGEPQSTRALRFYPLWLLSLPPQ